MPYNFDGHNDLYGVFNEERGVNHGDSFIKPPPSMLQAFYKSIYLYADAL